jgi:hypothetical protein
MALKRPVKAGNYLMHRALGQVRITEETVELEKTNTDESCIYVDHDGECKKVSKHLLYHFRTPVPQELINAFEAVDLKEEMREQGLL